MNIGFSNSGAYMQRTFERFKLLRDWTAEHCNAFSMDMQRSSFVTGLRGPVHFQGQRLGEVFWDGSATLYLDATMDDGRDWERCPITFTAGLDADDILPAVSILAMDSLYARRCGKSVVFTNDAFQGRVENLLECYTAAGLFPSLQLDEMVLI